jgi:hypothetical protein
LFDAVTLTSTQTLTNKTLTAAILGGTTDVSGGQLKFPAAQSPSADANTLDDYEEGTWTPSVGGSATYTTQNGTYTKVGRAVHIACDMTINAIGTGNTNTITNLPFTVSSSGNYGLAVGAFASLTVSVTSVVAVAGLGSTQIQFRSLTAAGVTSGANSIFGNGSSITVGGTFFI